MLVDPRSVPLGLCSWVFVCVTVRRWGNEPLNKWEGVGVEGQRTQEEFSAGFLKSMLNFQDAQYVSLLFQVRGEF